MSSWLAKTYNLPLPATAPPKQPNGLVLRLLCSRPPARGSGTCEEASDTTNLDWIYDSLAPEKSRQTSCRGALIGAAVICAVVAMAWHWATSGLAGESGRREHPVAPKLDC